MAPRRPESLSRDQIVATAVEVLDADGETGLTFRVLSGRLATGPGAIYWHVANKDELLDAATDAVVLTALAEEPASGSPHDRLRAVALGLFDAVDEHPWVAARLSHGAWQAGGPRIVEAVGRQVRALGVPQHDWFVTTTVLVQYILGAAAQNAANARAAGPDGDREEMLDAMATRWEELDPEEWSFARTLGDQMRHHDDREQFLAGIDIALAGIEALHPPT
ncbi:TetR/AcrR family transcriptional regulator [Actinomycetospora chiangmaiensis]|uniref:TetR/AcrR family transcriptional regulator n=1 Tax=Actinomycetospora chiangmaiensis TaxID=402650 RepID=UPI000373F10A|nr:TetR/AcrR family transcriptional regulator [Actinomycetospora chiangmaiensis]